MAQKIGLVANTIDPVNALQLQFYQVNAKQINQTTSIAQLAQELTDIQTQITALQATLASKQSFYNNIINYLTSIGVADISKPLTQAQIDTLTSAGYVTTAV
jgi:nitrate reductase assembly molybdenum cofactor insertion protein NarJ